MSVNDLKKSAVELNIIFDNLSNDLLEKIPIHLRDFFKQIASDNYYFEYDKTKPLNEQNIMPKTKGVLALIYRDYICNDEERETFINAYNTYLINKNNSIPSVTNDVSFNSEISTNKNDLNNESSITPTPYQKIKWYVKIFNFLKNLFKE